MKDKFVFTSTIIGVFELIDDPQAARKVRVHDFHLTVGVIPSLNAEFIIGESEKELLRLVKGDRLTYSSVWDDKKSEILFVGEIERQRIRRIKDKPTILAVEAVSPFMRLERVFLNQQSLIGCSGLRDILNRIREMGSIWGEFKLDEDVADEMEVGFINDYPALAFLKHIFLQRNLVYKLIHGYTFIIQNRATEHREAMADIPTLNANNVIEMEYEK